MIRHHFMSKDSVSTKLPLNLYISFKNLKVRKWFINWCLKIYNIPRWVGFFLSLVKSNSKTYRSCFLPLGNFLLFLIIGKHFSRKWYKDSFHKGIFCLKSFFFFFKLGWKQQLQSPLVLFSQITHLQRY